jgi:hypothetical protein
LSAFAGQGSTRDCPVISTGFGIPIRKRTVGAISARRPPWQASHAVGHAEKLQGLVKDDPVLVLLADLADVGEARGAEDRH